MRAVQAALSAGLGRLIANDPPTRLGDVEGLHQMRVATRRLRSDLRTFRPLLDRTWAAGLSDELRWLGDRLGAVRDPDVQLGNLGSLATDLRPGIDPYLERLRDRRATGREALLEALTSERYVALLDRLVDAVRDPLVADKAQRPIERALPKLVRRAWRRLKRAGEAIGPDDRDDEYHAVRIKAKRARYAAEAIAPVAGKRTRKLAEAVADLQMVLGDHQDAVVAEAWLREASNDGSDLALVAGELIGVQRAEADAGRKAWTKLWKRALAASKGARR